MEFCPSVLTLECGFRFSFEYEDTKKRKNKTKKTTRLPPQPSRWPRRRDWRRLYLTTQTSCQTRNVICCRGKRLLFFESGTSCNGSTTHDTDTPSFPQILSTTDAKKGMCVCLMCICVCVCVYGFVCFFNKVIWANVHPQTHTPARHTLFLWSDSCFEYKGEILEVSCI